MTEFEPHGDMIRHTVISGTHQGITNFNQSRKHKHSGTKFLWHRQIGKENFQRDRLYKVVRVIINKKSSGHVRLAHIMLYANKAFSITDENSKHSRGLDMLNSVYALFTAVVCKLPLSVFDNHHMTSYISQLDSNHSPPHRLEQVRILEVMSDDILLEFSKIVTVSL